MALNRLDKVWHILHHPQNVPSANIAKLFHYTYDENKRKIVGQDKVVFQLSRVDKFLDRNEGYQILEPYYHACGELYENKVIDKNFYKLLVSIGQDDLSKFWGNAWVICFSKNGNSPFLKRRYAAGDGWILGILFNFVDNICINIPDDCEICVDLYEIRYSLNKMCRIIKKALTSYYALYKQESAEDSVCKLEITEWLGAYSMIYKSADYKPEEEIRLVCTFPPDFSSWESEDHEVQFKSSVDGYDAKMQMILSKGKLIYQSQELNPLFDTVLNKTMLRGEDIRKALQRSGNTI